MLRLPPVDFRVPRSLDELLKEFPGENTRLVAGGTDLWPNMKRRHQQAGTVLSLMSIPELRSLDQSNGELRIGATTTLSQIIENDEVRERFPAFARALASISSPPLRNMGTLGGNLCVDTRCTYYNQTEEWRRSIDYCMKESGTICWVATKSPRCWAHSASDSAPILCALGARVRLVSGDGERVIPLTDLYRDDGIDYLNKKPDEILISVSLPEMKGWTSAYRKLRRRGTIDFPVVGAATSVHVNEEGVCEEARLALGAVASAPVLASKASGILIGKRPDRSLIESAANEAAKLAKPMDNTDMNLSYRKKMVSVFASRALEEAFGLVG